MFLKICVLLAQMIYNFCREAVFHWLQKVLMDCQLFFV